MIDSKINVRLSYYMRSTRYHINIMVSDIFWMTATDNTEASHSRSGTFFTRRHTYLRSQCHNIIMGNNTTHIVNLLMVHVYLTRFIEIQGLFSKD